MTRPDSDTPAAALRISVVIPTFNRSALLQRALNSVCAQTSPPLEIIVVDDGSEDDTGRMMREKFAHCLYLPQQNCGVSQARNRGIEAAQGDWIALLDSDDEWLPGKLSSQTALLESQPDCRICHTEEIWVRDGRRVDPMKKHAKQGGRIFQRCLPLCVISPSSVLIHRTMFDDCGLFDETLPACEDYDLWLRICATEAVGFVDQPQIIKYGGHPDQLSRRHWGMDRFRVLALEKILRQNSLADNDRLACLRMLEKKSGILAQGAAKRGRHAEAQHYWNLQERARSDAVCSF